MLYNLINFEEGLKMVVKVWNNLSIEDKICLGELYDFVYNTNIKEYKKKPYFIEKPFLIKYDVMLRVLVNYTDFLIIEPIMNRLPKFRITGITGIKKSKKLLQEVNELEYNDEHLEFVKELQENGINLYEELLQLMRQSSDKYKEYMKNREIPLNEKFDIKKNVVIFLWTII